MPSKQALLAMAAVAGFAAGGPIAGRFLGAVGLGGVGPQVVSVAAGAAAFLIAKRLL